METRTLRLAEIVPAAYNPRVTLTEADFEYQALKASIDGFGLVVPLIVNQRTGTLVSGHQRLNVLLAEGVEEAEAVIVDMEPEKEKALCVGLNKIKGEWDMEKLESLLRDEAVFALPTGFEAGEIDLDRMLEDAEPPDVPDGETGQEPEASGAEGTTVVKIGNFKFRITISEYQGLLNSIRDSGIFDSKAISDEMRRRILND